MRKAKMQEIIESGRAIMEASPDGSVIHFHLHVHESGVEALREWGEDYALATAKAGVWVARRGLAAASNGCGLAVKTVKAGGRMFLGKLRVARSKVKEAAAEAVASVAAVAAPAETQEATPPVAT